MEGVGEVEYAKPLTVDYSTSSRCAVSAEIAHVEVGGCNAE
jgi:hypothetical protein